MHLEDVAETARTGNVARLFDETARHHGDGDDGGTPPEGAD